MSSLLQHRGRIDRRGVELAFILTHEEERQLTYREHQPTEVVGAPWKPVDVPYVRTVTVDTEPYTCTICGKEHPRIWLAWRKPVGMWGCWVVFRYLGAEHVPDLSVPISVPAAPRGARRLDDAESSAYWHKE